MYLERTITQTSACSENDFAEYNKAKHIILIKIMVVMLLKKRLLYISTCSNEKIFFADLLENLLENTL